MSYLLRSFKDVESYNNSKVKTFIDKEPIIKEDMANKVMKQYYNKQFIGDQAFMVPKYYKETGNWDDKETTKLNLKQL
jgi:hypothetical protein